MAGLDHFGLLAPIYEKFIPLRQPHVIISMLELPVEGCILDAGGGTGRVAQALAGHAAHVVVADLSLKMLQRAAAKGGLDSVCSYSEALPFPDESFERVIMVDALHHVHDQPHTALEMWRVVKPGGLILIEEPDIHTLAVKAVALLEKVALMRSHFLSPEEIAALFSANGAEIGFQRDGFNAWLTIRKTA